MYAQAVSDAAVKTDVTGFALSRSPGRQPNSYLTAISSLERKAPGETLFAEGDETNSIYEIVRGMLRLVKLLPDGRRQITGFLSAGRLLGLAPEGAHVYTVEAITEVTLCRYGWAAFERLIDEVPGFAKPLLTVTSHELRVAQNQMLLLGRKTATEKVASSLRLIAEQRDGDGTPEVDLPMTRSDIADYLGLTVYWTPTSKQLQAGQRGKTLPRPAPRPPSVRRARPNEKDNAVTHDVLSPRPLWRALVVGADPVTLRFCRDALKCSGFAVDAVDSGIAAVVAAREDLPDLIFVDVQLRDVPGREAIRWLRSNPALQSTPIIVLTTNAEDDAAPDLTGPGPSLLKPVSLAALRRVIREVLE
jgi:CRP/FNR family transcriptional regulator, anaerobic regulatory protein